MKLKVLIRTPNHLGDCVMALPMISEAREAYPGSRVTILTPEHLAEMFDGNPGIDEIMTIPTRAVHGMISVFKIKEMIAGRDFDVGYILPPSFGAASAFKLAGVDQRIGYIADGRRLLLTKPLPLPTPLNSEHRSKVYFDLLRRGSLTTMEYVKPKLFLDENDSRKGMAVLDAFGVAEDDRYAVVAFRAVAESRRWGEENYTELVRRIVEQNGLKVVLVGSTADRKVGGKIVDGVDENDVANLAGKTSLRELAAICSRAQVFVGNDSGPAHLAAAVGAPLLVLSGADDPAETSPISSQKRLIYPDHLDCISCGKNKCPLKGDDRMRCMNEITVDMVIAELRALLKPA
jgi:heptosyltransferase-2